MQAGGKIEPGETPRAALIRELAEELALEIPPEAPEFMGRFEAPAANEPGFTLEAESFRLKLGAVEVRPCAEIEEALWLEDSAQAGVPLAPLLELRILPLLRRERAEAAARPPAP